MKKKWLAFWNEFKKGTIFDRKFRPLFSPAKRVRIVDQIKNLQKESIRENIIRK